LGLKKGDWIAVTRLPLLPVKPSGQIFEETNTSATRRPTRAALIQS
jgi:hypothetical protein